MHRLRHPLVTRLRKALWSAWSSMPSGAWSLQLNFVLPGRGDHLAGDIRAGRTFRPRPHAALDAGNEAWPRLRDALIHWRPLHEDHLAPIALLADPRAARLITPERGREVLATRRAEHRSVRRREVSRGGAWIRSAGGGPGVNHRYEVEVVT